MLLANRYEIGKEIGRGGMGVVHRAHDSREGRDVAVKLIRPEHVDSPEIRQRFIAEGEALRRLSGHPAIVTVYESGVWDGQCYIVMELLRGEPLHEMLHDAPRGLPVERAVGIALQIAEALAYGHDREVVHRDVKPSNIMICANGVRLCDFGMAKLLGDERSTSTRYAGTPLYMAPEQITGTKVDGRTDLYALGGVLYHMLTGRAPFGDGASDELILHRQVHAQCQSARALRPEIPGELDRLIERLLAKDRFARPATAAQVAESLRRILRPTSPPPHSFSLPRPPRQAAMPPPRRARLRVREPAPAAPVWPLMSLCLIVTTASAGWVILHSGMSQRDGGGTGQPEIKFGEFTLWMAFLGLCYLGWIAAFHSRAWLAASRARGDERRDGQAWTKEIGRRNGQATGPQVNILLVGFSGSGKSALMAALYRHFSLGGVDGIRLEPVGSDRDLQAQQLVELGDAITGTGRSAMNGRVSAGHGTRAVTHWSLGFMVDDVQAFTFACHDYAGGDAEARLNQAAETNPQFDRALAGADVLIGLLDGQLVLEIISDGYNPERHRRIYWLLNILIRERKLVHLVISKADLLRTPEGTPWEIPEILARLDEALPEFIDFRANPKLAEMQVTRVAAFGLDLARMEYGGDGTYEMVRVDGIPWRPWQVDTMLYTAVRDVLQDDVERLAHGGRAAVRPITRAVLAALGVPFHTYGDDVILGFSHSQLWRYLTHLAQERLRAGEVAGTSPERAALLYAFDRCRASAAPRRWH